MTFKNLLTLLSCALVSVSVHANQVNFGNLNLPNIHQGLYSKNALPSDYNLKLLLDNPAPGNLSKACNATITKFEADIKGKLAGINNLTEAETGTINCSGIFPNMFGRLFSCEDNPTTHYLYSIIVLFDQSMKPTNVQNSGVCLPVECSTDDADVLLMQLYGNFPAPEGFVYHVHNFPYSHLKSNIEATRPGFFYWYFVIIGSLTLFTIILTIINQCKKNKKVVGLKVQVSPIQKSDKEDLIPGTKKVFENKTNNLLQSPKQTVTTPEKSNTTWDQLLQAFDFVDRTKSLIVSKRPTAESGAFDIIRVISMMWVVLAHQFSERLGNSNAALVLPQEIYDSRHDWSITLIEHGFYAVDFFLFMGGYVAILSLQRVVNQFRKAPFWK